MTEEEKLILMSFLFVSFCRSRNENDVKMMGTDRRLYHVCGSWRCKTICGDFHMLGMSDMRGIFVVKNKWIILLTSDSQDACCSGNETYHKLLRKSCFEAFRISWIFHT